MVKLYKQFVQDLSSSAFNKVPCLTEGSSIAGWMSDIQFKWSSGLCVGLGVLQEWLVWFAD